MAEFLNNNIKYLRNLNKISQQELADSVGIDRSTISRIENNEIETTIPIAEKLAKNLNISFSDLVSRDLTNEASKFDELEVLFNKNKDILTDDDKEMIKFMIEKRKKEIDKQLVKKKNKVASTGLNLRKEFKYGNN